MARPENEELYDRLEAEQRLKATLRSAFNRKPTPLKDIPKKTGESRKLERRKITPVKKRPA